MWMLWCERCARSSKPVGSMAISWAGLAGAERQPSKQIGDSQRVARAKSMMPTSLNWWGPSFWRILRLLPTFVSKPAPRIWLSLIPCTSRRHGSLLTVKRSKGRWALQLWGGLSRRIWTNSKSHNARATIVSTATIWTQRWFPKMVRLMNKGKAKLSELMPCYFAAWEVYEKKHSLHHRPGLHLELFLHFVNKHCSTSPCRDHVGSDFPCGLLHLRQPGSGFNQGQRVDLHSLEADLEFNLKKVQKLLNSYLFHRAANFHQRPALDALVVAPPLGHCVLMVDFKELLTLPIGNVQTSEMFYATGRFEVCTFGGVLVEHLPGSTAAAPRVETSHILLFSSVLDHTALRANQLIDVCLGLRKGHLPLEGLHIVADAGMHFRSYESLYHHMVTLPAKHRVPCWCHWGVEKHFKSACDRMFGWLNSWITRAKLNGAKH